MDDILASIRRIIADDYRPKAADPEADAPDALASSDEEHDAPFAEPEPEPPVLAAVDAAPVAPLPADEIPEIEAPPTSETAPAAMTMPRQMPPPAAVEPIAALAASRMAAAVEPLHRQGTLAQEPRASAPGPVHAPIQGPVLDALVSSATTASVGESFHALSHTILTSNNARTLEDIVKDMLRPMLQVWLDDNLPPLVERLVRTEIERVARGRP